MIKFKKLPKFYKCCDKCGSVFKRNSGAQKYCFKCTTAMQRPEVQEKIRADKNSAVFNGKNTLYIMGTDSIEGRMPTNIEGIYKQGKYTSKFGWLEIGVRRHYMRSTWERNIGRYLEWLKGNGEIKNWDYECKRFFFEKINCGNRSYLPDFKVYENNGEYYWIEVKGYMTKAAKTKLQRMQRYYPEETVQILDAKQYEAMRKELRNLIPGWE